jgi:hypothetical protein
MHVLAAILTCSLHGDDALVRAIVDNVHDNPFAIVTPELDPDTESASTAPQTLDAAVAQLREVTAQGGEPLLGLMQVPVVWASAFGRNPEDLFDPCVNVSIGSAMLSGFDYACARSGGAGAPKTPPASGFASRRGCALRRYAQAIQMPELTTIVTLTLRYQRATRAPESDAPIFPLAPEERAWGSDRVFVPARAVDPRASVRNRPDPVPGVGISGREDTPSRSAGVPPSRKHP